MAAGDTTYRLLEGRLQIEIGRMVLEKRNVPHDRILSIRRQQMIAEPGRVWIEVHYERGGAHHYEICSLEEWCSF